MDNIKNKKSIFFLIIFMTLLLIGCEKRDNSPINDGATIINVDGINREYVMYIPSSYDSIDNVPLMLIFTAGQCTLTNKWKLVICDL